MPIVGQFGSLAGFGVFPGGALESIATVTLSSAASNIEFTSIPSGFQHLQVRLVGRSSQAAVADVTGLFRFNSDSGSNYARHRLYGYGSSAGADATTSSTYGVFASVLANNNTATCFSASVCDILDYASTTKNKTVRSLTGGDANDQGMVFVTSSLWMSTSAITSILLTPSSGNWVQHSTAALYGVRA